VAILAPELEHNACDLLRDALWSRLRPDLVAAVSAYPPAPGSPALLAERPLGDGGPAAYVCRRFVCQRPVTAAEELSAALG